MQIAGPVPTFNTKWHAKNPYLLAIYTILQVKFVNGNINHHALWNRNRRNTICIIWVIVRISGTSECIFNHWTTPCMYQSKRIKRQMMCIDGIIVFPVNVCFKWPWKASLGKYVVNLSFYLFLFFVFTIKSLAGRWNSVTTCCKYCW